MWRSDRDHDSFESWKGACQDSLESTHHDFLGISGRNGRSATWLAPSRIRSAAASRLRIPTLVPGVAREFLGDIDPQGLRRRDVLLARGRLAAPELRKSSAVQRARQLRVDAQGGI